MHDLMHNFYRSLFEKHKGNSKEVWRIVKEITDQMSKKNEIINPDVNDKNEWDPHVITNEFQKHFVSVAEKLLIEPDTYYLL